MHSSLIENYKKTLKLTKEQRAIIVGSLLGDGHLETSDKSKTYRLKIEHSIKQKEYVDWLYQKMKPWIGGAPKARKVMSRFPNGKILESVKYGFTSYSHGKLRFYGQKFYPKGKKVVPKEISRLLNPLAIAVWYLDDGSYKSSRHRTFIVHTHAYSKQDLKSLQSALEKNFMVKTRLHRQIRGDNVYWRIYILSESALRFRKLVTPTVNQIFSMRYKLGNELPKK